MLQDINTRSPKRQAQTKASAHTPHTSAASAVASLDAAIWTSVVEFLPIPTDIVLARKDGVTVDWATQAKHYDAAVSEVVTTWRTLLNLRLVSQELAALLHPTASAALWKTLVLQKFDFSANESGFNMENYKDDHGIDIPAGEVDPDDADGMADQHDDEASPEPSARQPDEQVEQDPQLVAMRGRYYGMPPNYLEEDLVEWHKLGIYHRPSQYGFLTTLQQQPAHGSWPESEDPFTLFGDLVRLLMLPHGDQMVAGGEGSDTTFKFLAAPTEADSSSAYFRFYVMKTLGYVPHFWHWGTGISDEWKGNTEPEAFGASIKTQLTEEREGDNSNEDEDDEEDKEEKYDEDFENDSEFEFPSCNVRDAKRLYQSLCQHCQDWRAVCCNSNSDGYTPVFFVGESKTPPHRWIGYAGGKCWT